MGTKSAWARALFCSAVSWAVLAAGCAEPHRDAAAPATADVELPAPSLTVGNLDARSALQPAALRDLALSVGEDAAARFGLEHVHATINPVTLGTKSLNSSFGYLTAADASAPSDIARRFVAANGDLLGVDTLDLDTMIETDRVYSRITGATHFYYQQTHAGLPVWGAQLQVHVNRDGRVMSASNGFSRNIARSINTLAPAFDAVTAVRAAASHLGVASVQPVLLESSSLAVGAPTVVAAPELSIEPVPARLAWQATGPGDVRLVYNLLVQTTDGQHAYDMTVDAVTGQVWSRADWTAAHSYRVFGMPIEHPEDGVRSMVNTPPDETASPQGWFTAGKTLTRGNNVDAYVEPVDAGGPAPDDSSGQYADCGASLVCDFTIDLNAAPETYEDGAIANLFYWNNLIHDIQYQYGFDEVAGSFQRDNFGRGGFGNDAVRAEAQDDRENSFVRNNANFFTPPDGQAPQMQMYLWDFGNGPSDPERDGDLSSNIIAHEYGHGISIRQVGGPGNSSCLNTQQQPGEGWADFMGFMYTLKASDSGDAGVVIGDWALGNAAGIRSFPYTTNRAINTHTYEDINAANGQPHATGEKFAQALWLMTWNLIDEHGFDPDLANAFGGAGNQRAMLYVNEGFKQTACSPSFADARDGILLAAREINGDEDLCAIWDAFAELGVGFDAEDAGGRLPVANGFQAPENCGCILPDEGVGVATVDGRDVNLSVVPADAGCGADETNGVATALLSYWERGDEANVSDISLTRQGDDFAGELPPQASGTVLQYRLEVTFDDGTVVTLPDNPADDAYTVAFGSVEEIYCTDFETDDHGFAFSEVGTFEIGPAVNGGGDPDQAFSGARFLGSAIGGTYENNADNDVASVTVSGLTGYDNLHLRYRRWLGVEDARFDQAFVRVGGSTVFTNQNGGGRLHHIDQEWRFVDHDISEVVETDAANIEFGIDSDGGLVFGGWNIDDVCVVSYVQAVCGDGTVNEAEGEECDDGNTADGDGCSATCTDEADPAPDPDPDPDPDDTTGGDDGDVGGGCSVSSSRDSTRLAFWLVAVLGLVVRRWRLRG